MKGLKPQQVSVKDVFKCARQAGTTQVQVKDLTGVSSGVCAGGRVPCVVGAEESGDGPSQQLHTVRAATETMNWASVSS